jgi:lysophospholipase L1-like esterase
VQHPNRPTSAVPDNAASRSPNTVRAARRCSRGGLVVLRVALALFGTCIALTLGELCLRLRPQPPWKDTVTFSDFKYLEYDPVLAWRNQANYSSADLRINGAHFRGKEEVSVQKPPGVERVVCLGDSRTFGIWLDSGRLRFDNAYPPMLETLLRSHGSAVEVLNAGVVGYSSAHGLRQLMTRVLRLQPDIVVVAFGFNDHSLAWNTALRCGEPHNPVMRQLLYRLGDLRTFELGVSVYQGMASLHPMAMTVPWVQAEEYGYNLRRFAEVSAAHGLHLLLLDIPLRPFELGDSLPAFAETAPAPTNPYAIYGARDLADLHRIHGVYHDVMVAVAAATHTPVADAVAAFGAHQGAPLFGRYDFAHYNAAGAQMVARTVAEKLLELGWLQRPASPPDSHTPG